MAAYVSHSTCSGDDDGADAMSAMFGPGHVDQTLRTAISACWMALPKDRRTVDNVEKEIRRMVDRALDNLRDDAKAFGVQV